MLQADVRGRPPRITSNTEVTVCRRWLFASWPCRRAGPATRALILDAEDERCVVAHCRSVQWRGLDDLDDHLIAGEHVAPGIMTARAWRAPVDVLHLCRVDIEVAHQNFLARPGAVKFAEKLVVNARVIASRSRTRRTHCTIAIRAIASQRGMPNIDGQCANLDCFWTFCAEVVRSILNLYISGFPSDIDHWRRAGGRSFWTTRAR